MKNIRKFNSIASAVITVVLIAWFASLAIRHYCSWGFFAGYSIITCLFMTVVHAFADNALSAEPGSFTEDIEEI